ncbi:hypothetical protein JGH11_04975 [Dysgonomonas sp. Marseille-P4677]|uniref:hypothetical protein n=1 Tax=Dysgonomonas sp. Marseille-P4677 TaxID=2364790 RepID=UPI001913F0B8|nr:hypothetical protein [Dysgonomonas sp. Marseille-P4677]MBK5720219.1 hypothetical protein [Dysgonomonas sp. Marseille-P4677]
MKTGYIKFSETNTIEVKLVDGTVWMTINEIADLFGVNIPAINNQQRRIFKDNLLKENEVTKEHRYTCPKHGECIRIYYNLEVIIFLSFRIETLCTKVFREWVFSSLRKSNSEFIDCNLIIKEYSSFNLN